MKSEVGRTTGATSVTGEMVRHRILITGRVQGVGFRPFVYRLARRLDLAGWVCNSVAGVELDIEGSSDRLEQFRRLLETDYPPLAEISTIQVESPSPAGYREFMIRESDNSGVKTAVVLPDSATCPDCRREILDPRDRRYRYPFTNCTNCGPRYSIIEGLPYDRANTTMRLFVMCERCRAEYENPLDRRFHAQPNACPECGPHLELWDNSGRSIATADDALLQAIAAIANGKIVALKGLGGFQLLVDAANDDAVATLRERKMREEKPLALMYPSLDMIRQDCSISKAEAETLLSPRAPILLARRLKDRESNISSLVAPGNPYLGILLPYTPLHILLMMELSIPIVATSGNVSDEPICIDEKEAVERLQGIADIFLVHNRPIVRQVDDSVVQFVHGMEMVLRCARGYAPHSIPLPRQQQLLAVGGHLKSSVAIALNDRAVLSQHIGDLSTPQAYNALRSVTRSLCDIYSHKPQEVIHDLHPDYMSTRFAADMGIPTHSVQHHLAHICGCMSENKLKAPLLGVAWDGTGYGTDGVIWGGEFLSITKDGYSRVATIRPFPLPGGEQAIREPYRTALGLLYELRGDECFAMSQLPPVSCQTDRRLQHLRSMLSKRINTPLTSSVGRLFDGVASLLDIRQKINFEGQAAMMLQFAAEGKRVDGSYGIELNESGDLLLLDWRPLLEQILTDIERQEAVGVISARFHGALADAIVRVTQRTGLKTVVLTGGCFQNRYLLEMSISRLQQAGFRAYWHHSIPTNDGGLAIGQLAAATMFPREED